jgi:hypothetical protein
VRKGRAPAAFFCVSQIRGWATCDLSSCDLSY